MTVSWTWEGAAGGKWEILEGELWNWYKYNSQCKGLKKEWEENHDALNWQQ